MAEIQAQALVMDLNNDGEVEILAGVFVRLWDTECVAWANSMGSRTTAIPEKSRCLQARRFS
jgi:hypothetical protein